MNLPQAAWLAPLLALALCAPARADSDDQTFGLHTQLTVSGQATPGFPSPYVGPNSLRPRQAKETIDLTLFAGVRLWKGGELWIDPEIDQGFGLSNTLGVAGFPSAEAYKVGKASPYARIQRLFFRQTIGLDGDENPVEAAANQLRQQSRQDRLVLTIGKFGVGDVFDTNRYAHDPRGDFLNWAIVDTGTFDYAADAWGYSTGVAAELYRGTWTVRAGLFNLSKVPNGETLEPGFRQYQLDGEIEHRHRLNGHDGAVRITAFRNEGRFGRFDDALAAAAGNATPPDTAAVRSRRTRIGVSMNLEQELSGAVGLFARAGVADGQIEPYDFSDIDRTAALGVSVAGKGWGRADDRVGIAAVVNGISDEHRRYLAAGGIGVLIGDGRLPHPGAEAIGEFYYLWHPLKPVSLTFDYQLVGNPGYNRDRGPAQVLALRAHAQF